MFRWIIISFLIITCSCATKQTQTTANEHVKQYVTGQIDSLNLTVNNMIIAVEQRDIASAKTYFKQARYHYKHLELLTEFYFMGISKAINGPALWKTEEYDDKLVPPTGFQVVEEILFTDDDLNFEELAKEVNILKSCVTRLNALTIDTDFTDGNIFQAARLQVLRVVSLGITGFDSPIALLSLDEARAALTGIHDILIVYQVNNQQAWNAVAEAIYNANIYIESNADFDSFNQAFFIRKHLIKISRSIYALQIANSIANNSFTEAVNMDEADFFQPNVFNQNYFAPVKVSLADQQVNVLGELLFFDPVLSGNGKRSCASCHQPEKAFTDGEAKSIAFDAKGSIQRNAPTLINSVYQRNLFWDQRVQFLEDQIFDVVSNPTEMHGGLKDAASRLQQSDEYKKLFANAFKNSTADNTINEQQIKIALTRYIASLQGLNSKVDQYFRDEKISLTQAELNGFNLFMGKAKCGTCHFAPLFNGTIPPLYIESESEVLGIPTKPDTINAILDPDEGKYRTYNREIHKHAFKTPTVRNAGLTAPYMHNGAYETLAQVIDFYNRGGGAGIGIDLPNQTLPTDHLKLTPTEQADIIEFLHALTDTTGMASKPKTLPSFRDLIISKRKIGGEY